jgi:ketosteroid isomerase-like protein
MKNLSFPKVLLALFFVLVSAVTLAAGSPHVKQGLSEPVKAWSRAVEAGDVQAITRMNPDQTVVYGLSEMQTKGTKNIVAGYAGMFDKYQAKVLIEEAQYIEEGSFTHSWGLFTLFLTPKAGGDVVVVKGRFSDIAKKVNGQWQYVMDHASFPKQ